MVVRSRTRPGSVVYARDGHGALYAIEVVEADGWDDRFLVAPALPAVIPAVMPAWLHVERATGSAPHRVVHRVAEAAAAYAAGAASAEEVEDVVGASLWPWSPYHRAAGAALSEFIAAGAVAVRHPQPVPADAARQLEVLAEFASGRAAPLGPVARLREEALERWLQYAFEEPDRLADAILLERIADRMTSDQDTLGAGEVVEALRFLREAEVDEQTPAHLDLAIDRRALLEQASPWRYLGGVPPGTSFGGALAAVRAWRARYRVAYEAHYRAMVREATLVRSDIAVARSVADALGRLDAIVALGPGVGVEALRVFHAADVALAALAAQPEPERARTSGITLGRRPAQFYRAWEAIKAVRGAFEVQRKRLAACTARLVLARADVPVLDRLLQTIVASDLDGIDRVLDERLAALIEGLLSEEAGLAGQVGQAG